MASCIPWRQAVDRNPAAVWRHFSPHPERGRSIARSAIGWGVRASTCSHYFRLAFGTDGPRPAPFGRDPPLSGEGEGTSIPVLATRFLRPSFAKPLHESVCLQKNKGRRSAERRKR